MMGSAGASPAAENTSQDGRIAEKSTDRLTSARLRKTIRAGACHLQQQQVPSILDKQRLAPLDTSAQSQLCSFRLRQLGFFVS